ncbi:DUF5018 domain-containing protein [Aquimarina spongiae]|uniref:DUF5018 domain-containing protein n=1 Tax=Aquimarina spongiae TaxID=570521 RepID=A0A1M6JI77_9FLAO|nr:DUF5018 domain-containing protein [Aquimarina spongiae]SHJ46394.1 protein of unknown function [Aquimarina spongiae]
MMKNVIKGVKMLLLFNLIVLTYSCNEDEEVVLSDENFITSFKLTSGNYEQNFEVKENTIQGSTPYFVDEEDIVLTILVSDKAAISPNPASITSIKDLTNFIITAENGEKRTYVIGINRELHDENEILSFNLKSGDYQEDFEVEEGTISGTTPYYIDDEDVTLTIEVSNRATVTPDPETIKSIKEPLELIVTAENGEEKIFNVDIKRNESPENDLVSFNLKSGDYVEDFEVVENEINGRTPYYIDDEDVTLTIEISNHATITPDPSTVKSIVDPITFTVTAENGDEQSFTVNIKRDLSPEKELLSFEIDTDIFKRSLDIDEESRTIFQRILPDVNLMSLTPIVTISNRATISPDPETILDYTNPIVFTVTAENGDTKEYTVTLESMDVDYDVQCDITNAFKWFGGDDRAVPDVPEIGPRNVGTGQTVILKKDTNPTSFGVHFSDPFRSDNTGATYNGNFEIKLNIRESNGNIIASKITTVQGPFNGGWVDFDLSSLYLLLENDTNYFFTWYLINGEALGVSTGSTANVDEADEIHNGSGFTGESKSENGTSLEDWDTWYPHEWHFSFRISGKQ